MEKKTERITMLVTPTEKKKLFKEVKEKNTTLSLLLRKKIFKNKGDK